MNELRSLLERGDGISDERFNRKTGEADRTSDPCIGILIHTPVNATDNSKRS